MGKEEDKIHKRIIIKNYQKYSIDKGFLVQVLNKSKKEEFTEKELFDMLAKENERVIN